MISVDTGREGSFSALSRIPVLFLLLMIIALYPFPASGADDVAILRAAERAASGTATEADEVLLFIENKRMNHLAMEGTLDGKTYRKVQGAYDKKNRGLAADAAAEAGLSAEQGSKRDSFRPGTDTDVQLRGKELSAGDVERARKVYNSRVEAYLRESGLAVERGVNWAARTETDIMPSPADMKSPGEFFKAASYINGDGGNMYASPLAAEAQGKLDRGDPVGIAEGRAYAEEMKSRIEAMKREKASLMKKYTASAEPADRSFLSAEIRKTESPRGTCRPSSPGGSGFSSPGSGESTGSRRGLQERGSGCGCSERSSYGEGTQKLCFHPGRDRGCFIQSGKQVGAEKSRCGDTERIASVETRRRTCGDGGTARQ